MESAEEEVHEDSLALSKAPTSFNGRLNIAEYSFTPKLEIKDEPLSRQRLTRSTSAVPPTRTSSSSSTSTLDRKRKVTSLTATPYSRKKSKSPAGYAPPSKYAHLPELPDVLEPNLICVFIGLNPGITTASSGHAYAHPSNLFWRLLHSSGCTTRRCSPQEDGELPKLFELGNTNIVARPTRNGAELSNTELDESVEVLEEKIRVYRPEAVCIVGKSIWESIWRVRHGKKIKKEEFRYGWQDDGERMGSVEEENPWEGARIFVATTTSGLAASLSLAEKERIWRELGSWVEERRKVRSEGQVKSSPE